MANDASIRRYRACYTLLLRLYTYKAPWTLPAAGTRCRTTVNCYCEAENGTSFPVSLRAVN